MKIPNTDTLLTREQMAQLGTILCLAAEKLGIAPEEMFEAFEAAYELSLAPEAAEIRAKALGIVPPLTN